MGGSYCEIDLREVESALQQAQQELQRGAIRAVAQAAREGLAFALARRRYRDRTGGLTGKAYAHLLRVAGTSPEAEIGWPVPYASFVDAGTSRARAFGFAGDAYLKAESVALREIDLGIARAQQILSR